MSVVARSLRTVSRKFLPRLVPTPWNKCTMDPSGPIRLTFRLESSIVAMSSRTFSKPMTNEPLSLIVNLESYVVPGAIVTGLLGETGALYAA